MCIVVTTCKPFTSLCTPNGTDANLKPTSIKSFQAITYAYLLQQKVEPRPESSNKSFHLSVEILLCTMQHTLPQITFYTKSINDSLTICLLFETFTLHNSHEILLEVWGFFTSHLMKNRSQTQIHPMIFSSTQVKIIFVNIIT